MTDMTDWDDDILDDSKADEGVIELTDIAIDSAKEIKADDIIELTDVAQPDDFIELTDIVQPEQAEFDLDIVTEDTSESEESMDFEEDPGFDDDGSLTEGLELELETSVDSGGEDNPALNTQMAPEQIQISQEQVESALERVIEKKFADKIESILFEVMEKAIEKELASINERLQKDVDQIETD